MQQQHHQVVRGGGGCWLLWSSHPCMSSKKYTVGKKHKKYPRTTTIKSEERHDGKTSKMAEHSWHCLGATLYQYYQVGTTCSRYTFQAGCIQIRKLACLWVLNTNNFAQNIFRAYLAHVHTDTHASHLTLYIVCRPFIYRPSQTSGIARSFFRNCLIRPGNKFSYCQFHLSLSVSVL